MVFEGAEGRVRECGLGAGEGDEGVGHFEGFQVFAKEGGVD